MTTDNDTQQVTLDLQGDNQPTPEEQLQAVQQGLADLGHTPTDEDLQLKPEDTQSEFVMPEKFSGKSAEEIAKAYIELEKMKAQQNDATEVVPEEQIEAPSEDSAVETLENAGLDFNDYANEFAERGELSEATYSELANAGIPKEVVDQYIEGQTAVAAQREASVYNNVGGRETYEQMTSWAKENFTASEVRAFNNAVNSGDDATINQAVSSLQSRFQSVVGSEPMRQIDGNSRSTSGATFGSAADMIAAMDNPLYKAGDANFMREFMSKVERSQAQGLI